MGRRCTLTDEQKLGIVNLYPYTDNEEICKVLDLAPWRLDYFARKNGLTKSKAFKTDLGKRGYVKLSNFLDDIKKNDPERYQLIGMKRSQTATKKKEINERRAKLGLKPIERLRRRYVKD